MKKFALVGEVLGHSISPQIHRSIYEKNGINASFELIECPQDEIDGLLLRLKDEGYLGLCVTIPYKIKLMEQVAEISPEARDIGAINTIDLSDDILKGYNTDYFGIEKSFELLGFNPKGKKALVLGVGGASKAVCACLNNLGATEIIRVARNGKGDMLFEELESLSKMDIIINSTPVGMHPEEGKSPVGESVLSKFSFAFDIVYNPRETKFMTIAKEQGLKTIGGIAMLVYQAIKSDEIWLDRALDHSKAGEIILEAETILSKG